MFPAEVLGFPPASPHSCPCWQSSAVLGFSASLVLWSPHVPLLRTEVMGGGPAALQADLVSTRSHLRGPRGRQNHTAREACVQTGAKSPGFPLKDPPRACGSPGSHQFLVASSVGDESPREKGGRERTVKEGGQGTACQSVLPQVPAQPAPPSLDLCSWVTSSHKPPVLTPPERDSGTVPPCPTHSGLASSLLLPGAQAPPGEPPRREALGSCPAPAPSTAGRCPTDTLKSGKPIPLHAEPSDLLHTPAQIPPAAPPARAGSAQVAIQHGTRCINSWVRGPAPQTDRRRGGQAGRQAGCGSLGRGTWHQVPWDPQGLGSRAVGGTELLELLPGLAGGAGTPACSSLALTPRLVVLSGKLPLAQPRS